MMSCRHCAYISLQMALMTTIRYLILMTENLIPAKRNQDWGEDVVYLRDCADINTIRSCCDMLWPHGIILVSVRTNKNPSKINLSVNKNNLKHRITSKEKPMLKLYKSAPFVNIILHFHFTDLDLCLTVTVFGFAASFFPFLPLSLSPLRRTAMAAKLLWPLVCEPMGRE